MIGELLNNRYEIKGIIGRGGMAIVYDAYDTLLSRSVAIKILKDYLPDEDEGVSSLRLEASASASLADENIVSIYDVGTTEVNGNNLEYIVMEKIEGQTLKDIIQNESPLGTKRVLNYALQITKALQAAHLEGVIHRDIKPSNILITKDDKVKVADFGIARVSSEATITYTSSILGTVHYISPEQAKGQPLDSRSDLYSLGIVLYELATGHVPFDGESPVSIAVKHIQEEAPLVTEVNPEFDEDLALIINKLMDKNPETRYKTASNLLIDLNKIKAGIKPEISQAAVVSTDTTKKQRLDVDKEKQEVKYQSNVTSPKDEKEEEKPSRSRYIVIGTLVALIIIAGLFGVKALVDNYIENTQRSQAVTVPSVIDLSESDAIRRLEDLGLNVEIKERVHHETIGEGNVIEQSVNPQRQVSKGSTVELTISRGKRLVVVPDVTGLSKENAENRLIEQGFEIVNIIEEESEETEGTVIKQIPSPNQSVEAGSKVDLYVSSGQPEPELVTVPDVIDNYEHQANSALYSAGLTVGPSRRVYSDKPENTVISQSVKPGEKVARGTEIVLEISDGPEPEPKVEPEEDNQDQGQPVQEQDYVFRLQAPNNDGEEFNVKIVNTTTGETVYNKNHTKAEAVNGIIEVTIRDLANSKYEVYFNDQKANVSHE